MIVSELIEFLQSQPQDMKVAYQLYSEQCLLTEKDIEVKNLCHPRPDGWVQNARPDKCSEPYLVLPGN